jgi:NADH-quinone oxidoreductase subunit A
LFLPPRGDYEKSGQYECGFQTFGFIHTPYDVQYYNIAILFLIFDVELILFYPLITTLWGINYQSFGSLILILFIFIVGLLFEWRSGILTWSFKKK